MSDKLPKTLFGYPVVEVDFPTPDIKVGVDPYVILREIWRRDGIVVYHGVVIDAKDPPEGAA